MGAAIHEAGHMLTALVLGCRFRNAELTKQGGYVGRVRHSPECGGALCRLGGVVAERLSDPNADLRGSVRDFADLRRDGISVTEANVRKVVTIVGHGKPAIDVLAAALTRKRFLSYEDARQIAVRHIKTPAPAPKFDAADWSPIYKAASVERRDLSELDPAVAVPHGACKCDVTTGKAGACDCDDQGDISFEQAKESMVIRFRDGIEAQQRFIAKCLTAKNASRHAANEKAEMNKPKTDDTDDCDCDEDTDPEDRCEDCDDEDSDDGEALNLDRADSGLSLEQQATARLRARTENAAWNNFVPRRKNETTK